MLPNNNNSSSSASASAASSGGATGSGGGALAGSDVDPAVWRASAGAFVDVPRVGARVYYFPQGHFEQCLSSGASCSASTSSAALSAAAGGGGGGGAGVEFGAPPPAFFLCRVVAVRFLCHPVTDQPFASIRLAPGAADVTSGGSNRNAAAADVTSGGSKRNAAAAAGVSIGGCSSSDGVADVTSGWHAAVIPTGGNSMNDFVADVTNGLNIMNNFLADVRNVGYNGENAVDDVRDGGHNNKRKENAGADVSSFGFGNVEVVDEDDVVSFTKILTPSDANNGGGFSVPRFCADSIFPPLDFEADPPVQNLVMKDVHGTSFAFRHIYRGTPRRHLLTTGWSKFVNSKKLVAGDSVVFMRRRRTGELYAGVRRAFRGDDVGETWDCMVESVKIEKSKDDEWTAGKGVVVDAVLETLEKAVRGMEFEVVFYPRPGWSEFIVSAESVEKAIALIWTPGIRVKMPMETEDSTRTTWFQGTVTSASVPDHGPWRGSPWRMLQVAWDEPEILQHVNRVNPWQVELVSVSFHGPIPPIKKFKAWEEIRTTLPPNRGEIAFSKSTFSNSSMGPLTTSYSDHTFFPAGMQGARQIQDSGSIIYRFLKDDIDKMNSDEVTNNNMQLKLETLSTELNIGSLPSDTSSVDNSSNCFNGTGAEGKQDSSSSTKVGQRSIQLFGKTIGLEKPAEDSGGNDECSS